MKNTPATIYRRVRGFIREWRRDYFSCLGLTSSVYSNMVNSTGGISNEPDVIENMELGHVVMLDVEGYDLEEINRFVNDNFNVAFVFMSSPGNYHVLCPRIVGSLEETYEYIKQFDKEHEPHREIGFKRGDWVIRISGKETDTGMPPVLVYSRTLYTSKHTYSRPHLEYIKQEHSKDLGKKCLDRLITEGDVLKGVKYYTFK